MGIEYSAEVRLIEPTHKVARDEGRSRAREDSYRRLGAAGAVCDVVSKLMGLAAQVTTKSGASGIAALDLVSPDDILGADSDFQGAFVLDRYSTVAACALGHHTFATN